MSQWYQPGLFLLHYDHAYSPADDPPPGTGLDPEAIARLLREVRPDAVHYTAKGHPGYVPYATRFGNGLPPRLQDVDAPERDVLATYREITTELGIRLVLGYSGLIDYHAAGRWPHWLRLTTQHAPYPNRALCPNSGYVDELMLPQLAEILERYAPDGIWIDADNWTVSPCYCPVCESEYQMQHARSAPLDRRDPRWSEWLGFHRESFQRYLTRVGRYLHDRGPELVYASNGAFCTHQPEGVPTGPDRLTWDLSPAYSLRQAGLEARFLDAHGLPFDLTTWNQSSARPWAAGRLPALPAYPKTFEHLAQEGAVIFANGGGWSVWVSALPDDALPERQHEVVTRAAEFARARRPWCAETEPGAYVAVLHSGDTHAQAGNGLYDPGPSLDRVRGAHAMLLELHHPHDVVTDDTIPADLDRYRVIVLPEQIVLPHWLDAPLTDWVRRGGCLIATGRVSPRIVEDIPTFALEEALGVRWTGRQDAEGYLPHRGAPLRIAAPVCHVSLHGAETLLPLLRSGHPVRQDELGSPAITRHALGEGEAYYVAADLCAAYHRSQYPGLRELLGDLLERALPQPPLLTSAPPTVEVVLRKREGQVLLHLVNHAPGKSLAQNNAFIETVPPTEPFSITLALDRAPAEVRLQPEDIEPEWSYLEGTLTAFVPPVHLHTALVVSLPAEEGDDEA